MDQKQKNILLLFILGLLVVSSLIFGLTGEQKINTIKNKEIFNVQDSSLVDQITIRSKVENIILKKDDGTWMINDEYKVEQNIVKFLLSILKDVEVVRKVPKTQAEEISKYIISDGYLIGISGNGKLINSFYSSGNANKTISYMMTIDSKDPMIVNIPGYESYVAGIFEIPANDWRDRLILSTSWRTLQKLNIDYTEYPEYNLNIKFDFNFLKIDGISNLDTVRMMSFIDNFNYLYADRYLNQDQIGKYDSLLNTPPTVTLSIEDIDAKNSKSINFYPVIKNDPMMLGYVKENDQMVLFEANRIQNLFAVKSDFEAKSNDTSVE